MSATLRHQNRPSSVGGTSVSLPGGLFWASPFRQMAGRKRGHGIVMGRPCPPDRKGPILDHGNVSCDVAGEDDIEDRQGQPFTGRCEVRPRFDGRDQPLQLCRHVHRRRGADEDEVQSYQVGVDGLVGMGTARMLDG